MRKKILFVGVSILIILVIFVSYLSVYGIKTNTFNNFINNKVKNYNSKLAIEVNDVYIKLNLSEIAININTKKAKLIAETYPINISNIDINLDLTNFLKNENSIKNIKIKSSNNLIKDVTSFLNVIDYNLSRYVFYSQIDTGFLNFELDTKFDDINNKVIYYFISGSVNNAKLNIPGYKNLDNINFNFQAQDKNIKISDLNFIYQNIDFVSKRLELNEEKSGVYYIKGDIENTRALIDPELIFKLINIKNDYLSKKDILFTSKNFFSFQLNDNKKISNIKIDSLISFDKIYFNNKYKNVIFLKEGTINSKFENKQFSADLLSKFAFSDDLKLNNEIENNKLKLSLKGKKNQKILVTGKISNGKILINPKIFLGFLNLDTKLISDEKVNFETNNKFKFEIINSKVVNYLVNSEVNLDKLVFNKEIQDIFYLKNVKKKLTFKDKFLKIDLKSNYSFLDKSLNKDSSDNIINLKLNKDNSKISNLEIFIQTDNNKFHTKQFKKYINFIGRDILIKDQVLNLNSNMKINASIDDKFSVKSLFIKSNLNFDNLNINYKSNLIKNYLENYQDKLSIKNPKILFELNNNSLNLQLNGKYLLNNKEDNFFIKFNGKKNNFELYSLFDLDASSLKIDKIKYLKKKNIPSKLEILINNSKNSLNIEKIDFTENKNNISATNLKLSNNFKIQSVDKINVDFLNSNGVKNIFKITKNSNNYYLIGDQIDGEEIVERILKGNSQNKIFSFFDNLNTSVILKLDKIYLEKEAYLKRFVGEFNIKNNNLILAKADGVLNRDNKFSYSYRTTNKDQKITNILIEEPKPFINNYKFIKGFEEGELKLNSIKIGNTSRSNLKINNFKVKEVPVLAKILTLASLQGMADLLTGEGIRFDEFEMDFKTKNKLTEIDEIYAIGPAISIMMEGYVEKERLTSLRGTLVPATTINKTIAKIPVIGNILVGSKTGEGVFGVSFKIKGPPNDLKSSVNPIKTLTPRFITRTLENLKGN